MVGIAREPRPHGHEVDDLRDAFVGSEMCDQNVRLGQVVLRRAYVVVDWAQREVSALFIVENRPED